MSYTDYQQSVVDLGVTSLALIPDRGSLDYSGRMVLDIPIGAPKEEYLGQFDLSIQLDGTDIAASGQVSALTNQQGVALGGHLAVSGGTLLQTADPQRDFLMEADLAGDLMKDGANYELSAKIQGDFFGNDAEGVAGLVYRGLIARDGDRNQVDVFDGSFAGQLVN